MGEPLRILRVFCHWDWWLYMSYLIILWILHYVLPKLFGGGGFVIYISCSVVTLPLHMYYICFWVDMFVHNITVSALTCLFILYNIIIFCTYSLGFGYILIFCLGYSTTVPLLHMCFYSYVCKYYIYFSWDMFV